MRNLATGQYTHDDILKMLEGSRAIGFEYELTDKDEKGLGLVSVSSGSIDFNSQAEVMGYGSFSIRDISDINYIDERIKPYFKVKLPTGDYARFPLGVYLIESPTRNTDGRRVYRSVSAYDKSVILKEDKFETRYRVAKNITYTAAVAQILGSTGMTASYISPSSLQVPVDIEFDAGTSKLSAINELLKAINYTPLHFDFGGHAVASEYVAAEDRLIEYTYQTGPASIVHPEASESLDAFNVPNVITRYLESPERGVMTATYVNEDVRSLLSVTNRGRRIVDVRKVDDIANQTTLNNYVKRCALEQAVYQTVTFNSALMPHHDYQSCLFLKNDMLGVNAKYIEMNWRMELKIGGAMRHVCRKGVTL